MYNTYNKGNVVYLYDCHKEQYIQKFPSYSDVLKFVAASCYRTWYNSVCSEYIDDINVSGDIKAYYQPDGTTKYYSRRYYFVDGSNRIIDIRKDWNIILKYFNTGDVSYKICWQSKKSLKWARRHADAGNYEFRSDPVPNVHKLPNCRYYRNIKVMNEYRQIFDDEYGQFYRPKRKNDIKSVVSYYGDDAIRSTAKNRSWKVCTKKRKQYM